MDVQAGLHSGIGGQINVIATEYLLNIHLPSHYLIEEDAHQKVVW